MGTTQEEKGVLMQPVPYDLEVMTLAEVARLLKVSPHTVRSQLLLTGRLPVWKIGRQWRFARSAVEQYMRESQQ